MKTSIYDIAVSGNVEGYYFKWGNDNWTVTYDLKSICSLCQMMPNDAWYMFGSLGSWKERWTCIVDADKMSEYR